MPRHSPCALLRFTLVSGLAFMSSRYLGYFVVNTHFSKKMIFVYLIYLSLLFGFQASLYVLSFKRTYINRCFHLLISVLLVGTNGLEPSTSRLSGVRSNHLSYAPIPFRAVRPLLISRRPRRCFSSSSLVAASRRRLSPLRFWWR